MENIFELYHISIGWESEDVVKDIVLGNRPLKPNFANDNIYYFDTIMYTKKDNNYFQICLKTNGIPFLINSKEKADEQLHKLKDDLWVIKGEWKKRFNGSGYHYCPTVNTPGSFQIAISEIQTRIILNITVNPNIEDFDIEALKDDFEGQLWSLLTSNHSKLNTDLSSNKIPFIESDKILQFLKYFRKISENPKTALKNVEQKLPYNKVRPIPSTYKALLRSKPNTFLPSKAYTNNKDIYENRIICSMLFKLKKYIDNNIKYTNTKIKRINNEISLKKNEVQNLKSPTKLNPILLRNSIKEQEEKLANLKSYWYNKSLQIRDIENENLPEIKLTIKFDDYHSNEYYWCNIEGEFLFIKIPIRIQELIELDKTYYIKCNFIRSNRVKLTNNGREVPICFINEIFEIQSKEVKSTEAVLKAQKINFQQLVENDFIKKLSSVENRERENQIETLNKRIKLLENGVAELINLTKEYKSILPNFNKAFNSNFYKGTTNIINVPFKPSMTFIQNHLYRSSLNVFKDILSSKSLNIKIFDLFDSFSLYGIRDMPILYELWLLIKVLDVISIKYQLDVNKNDISNLLKTITPNSKIPNKHIELRFNKQINGREIIIHYQKKLSNLKRPDIILEIKLSNRTKQVVLDAKYKNYNYTKSAAIETINVKDKYAINANYFVFITHPCQDVIREEYVSKLSNYGGTKIYNKNSEIIYPFHKFGFFRSKPLDTRSIDIFIGMCLEYLVEENLNAKIENILDPKPQEKLFCFSCGAENISVNTNVRRNNFHYDVTCNNESCGHISYIDYCWNCKTKLFKHGRYWDYHRTSAWSPFDIHCPNCGLTVKDYVN